LYQGKASQAAEKSKRAVVLGRGFTGCGKTLGRSRFEGARLQPRRKGPFIIPSGLYWDLHN
jgi:hypothetical protein